MTGDRERGTFVSRTCNMLRGWKSASCNGFPAPSGGIGDVMEVRGNLLATRDIPILPNQLLRSIPLISPPVLFNRVVTDFLFFVCLLLYRLLSLVKVA